MKLVKVKLENFRGYKDQIEVELDNLTAFVGKNDIGKSTVLEALDIFFNEGKGAVKIDTGDINKQALEEDNNEIVITACFEDLPSQIVIDSTSNTTLESEYLLNSSNQLEIIKKFVRVDLYFTNNKVVFGEMTFYPWSGYVQFKPDSFDYELGEHFNINF